MPARRSFLRDSAETVLVAIVVVLATTTFVVQNSVIPSASMEDTLLVGDYVLVNRIVFSPADRASPWRLAAQREIRRDDVVVFKYPRDPTVDYIKRVVGVPGDVVEIRAKRLYRNGEPVEEPHAVHKHAVTWPKDARGRGASSTRDNFGPVTVPVGSYFVLGDNRDFSADSREWRFLPRELITGRALVVFWSRQPRTEDWQDDGTWIQEALERLRDFGADTRWRRTGRLIR